MIFSSADERTNERTNVQTIKWNERTNTSLHNYMYCTYNPLEIVGQGGQERCPGGHATPLLHVILAAKRNHDYKKKSAEFQENGGQPSIP